jgi:hypothetical protein
MGETFAEITLKNVGDCYRVKEGLIKRSEVRETTLEAVADTGAATLVINETVRAALGLEIIGPADAYLADGKSHGIAIAEAVEVHWKDRVMTCLPYFVASAPEVLLGAIPLEDMDLIVDPVDQRVVGKHGDKQIRMIR